MVSAIQMQNYYRQGGLAVDTHTQQKYFEDDDCILDDNILDQSAIDSGLEMSPNMADSRRESFAVSSTFFSPKTEAWAAVEMESNSSQMSNNPFMEPQQPQAQHLHSNNPFLRMEQHQHQQSQTQPFIPQPTNPWSMSNSGSCTPMAHFDGLPAEYDSNAGLPFQRPQIQGQTPFSNPAHQVSMFPTVNGHPMQQSSSKDGWMSNMKDPKNGSPTIRSHNELRRGDGIRKKNARFDIPAERTLNNIDALIAQSTDDAEIKELKQQKRLLRNRQAALDSRQRKKMHTERLEDEKKQFTAIIGDMESEMDQLRQQLEHMMHERQQDVQVIEQLKFEKEEMVRTHTLETGELRKKVSVLTNHVQALEGAAMSQPNGMPNQAFHGAPFGDMDGITMDGSWDNMNLFGADFPMEQAEVKQEMQIVPTKKPEVTIPTDVEKPATQGGLLFMLFLVGAFVLSSRQPNIPRVSEDVRAASASILENVLKDAGVAQSASGSLGAMAHQPTGTAWASAPTASMPVLGNGLDGVAPSMLGDLSDSLTQPTQEQQNEQLFGLTPAQYDGVTSQDFMQHAPTEKPTSQGRRNLAQALASMRSDSKAEVYTRSLLWEQIPGDVVRTFAKMVAECNNPENNAAA
ncbi:bZIP transcription factor 49 [Cytospora mali]|uniref:BZIP transcription factor 49 n=1 Tax=Cytospora mali TaxID=578113 RepID=A0A194VFH5_CYTMA|nr:bZIP transcription factor 49 [Valsa mali var. pyri (nom. inval.)]